MPIFKGTHFTKKFTIKDRTTGEPQNITGWELRTQIRDRKDDEDYLVELTTANGGWVITDAANGRVEMHITDEQTANFEEGKVEGDVLRTDADPGPLWLFGFKVPVQEPVTRDE